MKKVIITITLAIFALVLTGAKTREGYPACVDLKTYENFLKAIIVKDTFATEYYMSEAMCGLTKPGIKATLVEKGEYWVKVIVEPEGTKPFFLYMDEHALIE